MGNQSRCLRFGVFDVDLGACELKKRGSRLKLQGQPFQVLAILLEKPGELVTREELRDRLWPGTIVDFDHGVNKAISKIREALGDSAEHPRFIETVARRGYRFLADVAPVDISPEVQPAAVPERSSSQAHLEYESPRAFIPAHRPLRAGNLRLAAASLAVVLLASLSWILYFRKHASPQIRSIAVLPLESLSSDPSQDYFADGMTDALIARLGQIRALRVISRTSAMTYKHIRKSVPEIASELNVDAVVEGTVMRSDQRVRITAQLIQVPDERHIWAEIYDGDLQDTLALQNRVALAIAQQVRATLSGPEQVALTSSKAVNPAAYEAYLKGRYFWNKRTGEGLKKAIEYFNRAVEADPNYAEAYSGLADSYALSGDWEYGVLVPRDAFPLAKTAAAKALALDGSLGEAHTSLAFTLDLYGWDWETAEQEYKLAIKLSPSYATAHQWYASHLMVMGQNSEAIFELRKAKSLDPLSLIISADLSDILCVAHLYDESVQESKRALEIDPNFAVAHYVLGQALTQKHIYGEAIAEFQLAIALSGHNGAFDANLAYAYALSGQNEQAMGIVKNLEASHDQNPSAGVHIALIYVGLGDPDEAMVWLNKAYEAKFNPSILLRPAFDNLRSDARFQELLRRIGLPHAGPALH